MSLLAGVAESTVRLATPLLLAAMGEIITERSGVINLGVEGMMLGGALGGFVGAVVTGNLWVGFAVGLLAGAGLATVHAILCLTLNADQVISGIMLTLLGTGLTTYFGRSWAGENVAGFETIPIPVLVEIPILGEALFSVTAIDYLALLLVPAVWYFLFRTNVGREITAVGNDPETADAAGVPVFRIRYGCVLLGGAFAGAAGAHLSLAFSNFWSPGMVAGRGWIAVALVILAQWGIWRALAATYLFGSIDALSFRSAGSVGETVFGQEWLAIVLDFAINPQVMQAYPYLVTIVVLWYVMRESNVMDVGAPSGLAESYSRERD